MPRSSALEQIAADTAARWQMLPPGTSVVAAVSGGADSMALLQLLLELAPARRLQVTAAHLNHCLRGPESDRDEQFVTAWCAAAGVDCVTRRADVAGLSRRSGQSLEEAARTLRYDFLYQVAAERGAVLATAHTATDNFETALFRLARGTGLGGLCGIPPVRGFRWQGYTGRLVRPLIEVSRRQVEDYCQRRQLPYITDSTNLQPVYSRNRLRLQVLPVLRSLNSALEQSFVKTARHLGQDQDYLCAQAEALYRQLAGGSAGPSLDAAGLLAAHPALAARVAARFLKEQDLPAGEAEIQKLLSAAAGTKQQLTANTFLCLQGTQLCLYRPPAPAAPIPAQPVAVGKMYSIGQKKLMVCVLSQEKYGAEKKINKKFFINFMDYDKICNALALRSRQPGDRIHLAGRGVGKTVKKLLNEQKVPSAERCHLPLLADQKGVVCLPGIGIDSRVAVDEKTKNIAAVYYGEDF
ncbi:tRNA lysidine(34) synthetase TilS [Neobittarella massiliensis]|uniref:tRNA(Ile)-lysidine synthase n=1 Tax=Neobittarella massiliensis (ex Bilen et al. 2018) TaxID=2041842 RepID=A0A8J6IQF3_9FIRM|nr:tRNA lysidine(34) synthetase TilS [Neobittarella massiliensis]MBC3516531.1 tRNA lysidine(34) synthetase TilS [Neobittarella massiliensis]